MQGTEFGAAADVATGAVVATAVDTADAARHGTASGERCLNCGAALAGDYCHHCGQPAHLHRTLMSILHDVLHGVYHFEGKIWRTLPLLFFKPGSLTRRFIAGERAKFVSPLALFLFSVFLMVATFESVGGPFGSDEPGKAPSPAKAREVHAELAKTRAEQQRLKAEIARLKALPAGPDGDAAETRIDRLDHQLEEADNKAEGLETVLALGVDKGDLATAIGNSDKLKVNTGWPALDARVKKAAKSPDLFLYKLQSNAYKYSWMLIPISLPFIWLLFFWRRDVGPYDHTIFAIYSLSAMTIGVVVLSIAGAIGVPTPIIATLFAFGPPLHIYTQLRGAYGIGRWGAAVRTLLLLVSSLVTLTLFLLLVLSVAA